MSLLIALSESGRFIFIHAIPGDLSTISEAVNILPFALSQNLIAGQAREIVPRPASGSLFVVG
jgi:HD-like signal output (HDOD) protein